jgi:hypothetical protein
MRDTRVIHQTTKKLFVAQRIIRKTKRQHTSRAISDIVGTILLLSISLGLLSVVYIGVYNVAQGYAHTPIPTINIMGSVEGNYVVLKHHGGSPLASDTIIRITIPKLTPSITDTTVADSRTPLTTDSWKIGDTPLKILIDSNPGQDLIGYEIRVEIIDKKSNSLIMRGIIQEGDSGGSPWVVTGEVKSPQAFSATLSMTYNFITQSNYNNLPTEGYVHFRYWEKTSPLTKNETFWVHPPEGPGGSNQTSIPPSILPDLIPDTLYVYQAQIQFGTTILSGENRTFRTLSTLVGKWLFDNNSGDITYDTGPTRQYNGTLKPDHVLGPHTVALNSSDYGLSFDGLDDFVEVTNFRNITDQLTIEADIRPSNYSHESIATINQGMRSQFFDSSFQCGEPDVIRVSSGDPWNVYAVVGRGILRNNFGYLTTFKINKNNGNIFNTSNTTLIDCYKFEGDTCLTPKIMRVGTTNYFAITYTGPSTSGKITTIQIANDGTITKLRKSFLNLSAPFLRPDIINVSDFTTSHRFAVVYTCVYSYGRISTFNISDDGVIDSETLFTNFRVGNPDDYNMVEPDIKPLHNGDHTFVIVFRGVDDSQHGKDDDGSLRTVQITPAGSVTSLSNLVRFDNILCRTPEIIYISEKSSSASSFYAIVYGAPPIESDVQIIGRLITIELPNNGDLGNADSISSLSSYDFETNRNRFATPRILTISRNASITQYAIIYKGGIIPYDSGFLVLKTIGIYNNNAHIRISTSSDDKIIFTTNGGFSIGFTPEILPVQGNIYLLFYSSGYSEGGGYGGGYGQYGVMKTVTINPDGIIPGSYPIIDAKKLGIPFCRDPNILPVSDTIYAIVNCDLESSGYIRTIKITDGTIMNTLLSSYCLEKGQYCYKPSDTSQYYQYCSSPQLCKVSNSGDIYAVFYCTNSYHIVKTFTIDPNSGAITFVSSVSFYPAAAYNKIIKLSEKSGTSYFAVSCETGSEGYIETYSITQGGTSIQQLQRHFYAHQIWPSSITCVSHSSTTQTGVYAIAFESYKYNNGYLYNINLTTVNISDTGTTVTNISTNYQIETNLGSNGNVPQILPISQDGDSYADNETYVIVYTQPSNQHCGLKTVKITNKGIINGVIDTLLTTSTDCMNPTISYIGNRNYVVIYSSYNKGKVLTLRISLQGHIASTFDTMNSYIAEDYMYGHDVTFMPVNSSGNRRLAVVYCGDNGIMTSLFVRVLTIINTPITAQPVLTYEKSYFINATNNMINVTLIFNDGTSYTIKKSLVGTLQENSSNHIKINFTKKTGLITLRINNTQFNTNVTPGLTIKGSLSRKLIFGTYSGTYNTIKIYSQAL